MSAPQSPASFAAACPHKYFAAVADHIFDQVISAQPESILLLVGAAQSGKSTLARNVRARLRKHYADSMATDPTLVPFTHADLIWERRVGLNFRELYVSLLTHCSERVGVTVAGPDGNTTAGYRGQLAAVCRSRKTRLIFLDEGQQLTGSTTTTGIENLRAIKNLAVTTRCSIVVCATYEILEAVPRAAEIEGRLWPIHLPVYEDLGGNDVATDWRRIVKWCEDKFLDSHGSLPLCTHAEEYRTRCDGRVGTLIRCLSRAVAPLPRGTPATCVVSAIDRSLPTERRTDRLRAERIRGRDLLATVTDNDWRGLFDPRFWNTPTMTSNE